MSLKKLQSALDRVGPGPIYLVVGDPGPLVQRAVAAIRAAVTPMVGIPAFNVAMCRCGEDDPHAALAGARTLPMMASRRLVIIRGAQDADDAFWRALAGYLERPPEATTLVVTTTKLTAREKARSGYLKATKELAGKHGEVVSLSSRGVPPATFAVEVARRLGKTLSTRDAALLVEIVGSDLGRIEREVEKVAVYVGEADTIEADAIQASGTALAEAVIWDLTTGVAAGDWNLALTALHRLHRDGNDPRRLLAMILWQYRELMTARALLLQGADHRTVTRRTKVKGPVLAKVGKRLVHPAFDSGAVFTRLRDAHFAMNGHRAGAERVLEALVFDLMQRGARAH